YGASPIRPAMARGSEPGPRRGHTASNNPPAIASNLRPNRLAGVKSSLDMTGSEVVLPRQLTDVSDDVRSVPPPPTPIVAEPFSICLADPNTDAAMISEWMNRPHLVEAWEYPWSPSRWHRHLRAQLD